MIVYTMGTKIDDPCSGCNVCSDGSDLASSYLMSWPNYPTGDFAAGSVVIYKQPSSFLAGSGYCQLYIDTTGGADTFVDLLSNAITGESFRYLWQEQDGIWRMLVGRYNISCLQGPQVLTSDKPIGSYSFADGIAGSYCITGSLASGLFGTIS